MGYRLYLGTIDKKIKKELSKLDIHSFESFFNDTNDCFPLIQDFPTLKNVFEIGSHYDGDILDGIELHRFFEDEDLHQYYNQDTQLHISNAEGLRTLIDYYAQKARMYYQNLLEEPTVEDEYRYLGENIKEEKIYALLYRRKDFWELSSHSLNKKIDSPLLLYTNEYEFEVFNLLHLLKTIDWEKKDLLIYGY